MGRPDTVPASPQLLEHDEGHEVGEEHLRQDSDMVAVIHETPGMATTPMSPAPEYRQAGDDRGEEERRNQDGHQLAERDAVVRGHECDHASRRRAHRAGRDGRVGSNHRGRQGSFRVRLRLRR